MNQAEERRGERQTFELEAEEVRNRRGLCVYSLQKTREKEGVTQIEQGGKVGVF